MGRGTYIDHRIRLMDSVGRLRFLGLDRVDHSHKISPLVAHLEIAPGKRAISSSIHELQCPIRSKTLNQARAPVPRCAAESIVVKT